MLRYNLFVRPDNDPPRAFNDFGLRTLEDQVLVIDPAALLANDRDENGDVLVIEGVMGCSNMGGQSATIAKRQGFIGAIVDATVRDPAAMSQQTTSR